MHVLSTPPAFILSQDQTLMFYLFQNLAWLNILVNLSILYFWVQSLRLLQSFDCVRSNLTVGLNYSLVNLSRLFHCLIFKVLNFQLCCSATTSIYYHVSEALSRTFFIFFCPVFCRAIYIISCPDISVNTFFDVFCRSPSGQLVYTIIYFVLCQLYFLQIFFIF